MSATRTIMSRRAEVAALARHRPPDDPELIEARRNLRASRMEDQARKVAAEFPPLTDEQVGRIVSLLRGGGNAAA